MSSLILHGFWDFENETPCFTIWAESDGKIAPILNRIKGPIITVTTKNPQNRGMTNIVNHPFALTKAQLTQVLSGLLTQDEKDLYSTIQILHLPCLNSNPTVPILSTHFQSLSSSIKIELKEWITNVIQMSPRTMIYFLLAVENNKIPELILGDSLNYWIHGLKYLLSKIAMASIIPILKMVKVEKKDQYYGCWAPRMGDEDYKWYFQIISQMPSACLAFGQINQPKLNSNKISSNLESDIDLDGLPKRILDSFFTTTTSAIVQKASEKKIKISQATLNDSRKISYNKLNKKERVQIAEEILIKDFIAPSIDLEEDEYRYGVEESIMETIKTELRAQFEYESYYEDPNPFRLAVKLNEPSPNKTNLSVESEKNQENHYDPWTLELYLQDKERPEILVSIGSIWNSITGIASMFNRPVNNLGSCIYNQLSLITADFPLLQPWIQGSCLEPIQLSSTESYEFLTNIGSRLIKKNCGVILPEWWEKNRFKPQIILNIHPENTNHDQNLNQNQTQIPNQSLDKDPSEVTGENRHPYSESNHETSVFNIQSMVQFDWKVAIGNVMLSEDQFQDLVQQTQPLVQIAGQWVSITPTEIQNLKKLIQQTKTANTMSLAAALRLGMGRMKVAEGFKVQQIRAENELQRYIQRLNEFSKISSIDPPLSFQGQLRPYQQKGLAWLNYMLQLGFGVCLADDMGLGKTVQIIALLLTERAKINSPNIESPHIPLESQTTLIVCPVSILGNWQRELTRFSPTLKTIIHHGSSRYDEKELIIESQNYDVILTTYSLAFRDLSALKSIKWRFLIIDEAQNIKNHLTKQHQAVKQIQAFNRIALTGTPIENRLTELWSIMNVINPEYLGSLSEFKTSFETPIMKQKDSEQIDILQRLIQPFVLRRLKTDKTIIQDLPDKIETKEYCNITTEQASLYQNVVDQMMEKIQSSDGIERKGLILTTLLKLKQVCDHPNLFLKENNIEKDRSGKIIRLLEMLEEVIESNEKALIFTQYVEMGKILQKIIAKQFHQDVFFFSGETPQSERDRIAQLFQDTANLKERESANTIDYPKIPDPQTSSILILSLKAGGTGLNLTGANHVFHFDRWWNPAVENQATDRAFRIGQRKNVEVHKFICAGTLEERIDEMIEQKKTLAENIIGAGESWLTELTTDQLRDLFKLSREIITEDNENGN